MNYGRDNELKNISIATYSKKNTLFCIKHVICVNCAEVFSFADYGNTMLKAMIGGG